MLGATHDPAVAFAHGMTIMVFIAAFGDISGCHKALPSRHLMPPPPAGERATQTTPLR
jgi:hypothetical protein